MRFSAARKKFEELAAANLYAGLAFFKRIRANFPERERSLDDDLAVFLEAHAAEYADEQLPSAVSDIAGPQTLAALEKIYYEPRKDFWEDIFRQNLEAMESHPYYYSSWPLSWENCSVKPLLFTDSAAFTLHKGRLVTWDNTIKETYKENLRYFLGDCPFPREMEKFRELYKNTPMEYQQKRPAYFYFSGKEVLETALFAERFSEAISEADNVGVVIIGGEESLESLFSDAQTLVPQKWINVFPETWDFILKILQSRDNDYQQNLREIRQYYADNENAVNLRVRAGQKLKIVFISCLFTTAIQYRIRDAADACRSLGHEAHIAIEKNAVSNVMDYDLYATINRVKPDIIFTTDYFRPEVLEFNGLYHVCWIQDPLPSMADKEKIAKLTTYDLSMSLMLNWNNLVNLYACEGKNFMAGLVPGNDDIYKPYTISPEEHEKYDCDVCLVCHDSDYMEILDKVFANPDENLNRTLKKIALNYHNDALKEKLIFNEEDFYHFCLPLAEQLLKSQDKEQIKQFSRYWSEQMFWVKAAIYRNILVEWLLEAGITNIKLWGNDWPNTGFRKYAMGSAENGEALAKITQCSKINLGNNAFFTSPGRVFETMLSGGFYLSNYIPEADDAYPISKILKEDEELVFFRNKTELIKKVKFYLENEEERQRMAEIGRKVCLEKMTYKALMRNMTEKLAEMAEKNLSPSGRKRIG
ncbi:MAG: glycosyltransferase [Syntrophomonadaceae bacterium]|jgi:spore maturation protein CgeB|nr:glycosyltransferase [Syntrophomonadaceae bacterium]